MTETTLGLDFSLAKAAVAKQFKEMQKHPLFRVAAKKRETKQKIMAIMESKKNEALAGKSLEELEAMLQTM